MAEIAINTRTARKAAIKRASRTARRDMDLLDRRALQELTQIYRQARRDIEAEILAYAGRDATLRLEVMRDLLRQINERLRVLSEERDRLLDLRMNEAARVGVRPFAVDGVTVGASLTRVADEALRFVRTFVAEDGLQLSDRIWRLDRHARDVVTRAVEGAVIQGHSASQAAQEFLSRGIAIPRDVSAKIEQAGAARVARGAGEALMVADGNPYDNALRVFRTEINRAHGQAYQDAAEAHPDSVGTRFLLSPLHPEPDICDLHASANLYGLGPGVYPPGRNPWPAHPNTLSYTEVVFADEVTAADRGGKETRMEWLAKQPAGVQVGVLGGQKKRAALVQGLLRENEIATPWRVLKQRYIRRGIDVDELRIDPPPPSPPAPPPPSSPAVPTETAQARAFAPAFDDADQRVLGVVNRFPAPREIPAEGGTGAYHLQGGIMMGTSLHPLTPAGRRVWRHEYGHYIDYRLRGQHQFYASNSPAGHAALAEDAKLWARRRRSAWQAMLDRSPALAERFRGQRFSESRYQDARLLYYGSRPAVTPAAADAHFATRSDIWARVWRAGHSDAQWRARYSTRFYEAAQVNDLSFLAEYIPDAVESHINIADLVGSITRNKSGWGHDDHYYSGWPHRQAAEAFANSFDLLSYRPGSMEEDLLELFAPSFSDFVKRSIE